MKKTGFTLIELALVIAVIGILIAALTSGSGIRNAAKVQSAAESVRTLRIAAENYIAAGKLTFTGISVDVLRTEGYLPSNFATSGTNPWGGDYSVDANSLDSSKVDISLTSVPSSAGSKLNTLFANSADSTSYEETTSTWSGTF